MIATLLLLAVLIVCSGFFSGAEIAIFSMNEARLRSLQEEGVAGAATLLAMKREPERLLTTILVGNNIVNIGAASLATRLALDHGGNAAVAFATGAMTLLVLVFGEIAPKSFAAAHAARISVGIAPAIRVLSLVLAPLVVPLTALARSLVRRAPDTQDSFGFVEGEIREMAALYHEQGAIEEHERQIIDRAFRLDKTRAWDIMTPRVDIFAWPASRTLAEIAPELRAVRYSRVPVFGDSIDDIVGVVYTRDAYQALVSGQRDVRLGALSREPFFVPGSVPLVKLLADFQSRRSHLGVVIDEYGGTDGLVTLEDVVEELVGEIVDETDLPEQPIIRLGRNEILVQGAADLREINHFFNAAFPQLEHRSLNGYLLDELGHVPKPGQEWEHEGIYLRVEDATETQVLRVRLSRASSPPDDAAPEGNSPART